MRWGHAWSEMKSAAGPPCTQRTTDRPRTRANQHNHKREGQPKSWPEKERTREWCNNYCGGCSDIVAPFFFDARSPAIFTDVTWIVFETESTCPRRVTSCPSCPFTASGLSIVQTLAILVGEGLAIADLARYVRLGMGLLAGLTLGH